MANIPHLTLILLSIILINTNNDWILIQIVIRSQQEDTIHQKLNLLLSTAEEESAKQHSLNG